jgi:large subunit ribosomal protein L10
MANQKILDKKQEIINEIADKVKNSNSVVFFEYQGLTVTETNELRRKLKESGSEYKVYKNTLATRALNDLKIDVGTLEGPKAIAFSSDAVAPIKVLADFAKTHPALELKVGIVDGNVTDTAGLKALSTIPSREGLLTMLAGGMIATVKDLAICLDLYSKNLEK